MVYWLVMPSEHSETDFSPKSVIEIARQNEVQTKEKRHSIKEKAAHFLHQSYEKFISRRLAMATREEMAGYKTVGEAIHQATPELNIDDPEYHLQRRLVANKEFALWYLIASKRYLKPAKEMAGPKASPDQVIDAETELAEAFLETQTTKNQESDHFRSPYLPSAGIEVEYLLSNLPVNRLDDLRKKHGFTHEDKPDAMGLDYQHDPTWDKVREILGSWQRTFTPFQYMREMGGFNNTISEVSFNPSASMKTQLRELLYLNKLNLVEPSYGVHININRLGISISHPEPMIITSLLTGCYYDKPNPSKKDRLLKMLRQPFHRDSQASPDSYLDSPSIIEDFPNPRPTTNILPCIVLALPRIVIKTNLTRP